MSIVVHFFDVEHCWMTWPLCYCATLFNFNKIGLGLQICRIGFRDSLRIRDFCKLDMWEDSAFTSIKDCCSTQKIVVLRERLLRSIEILVYLLTHHFFSWNQTPFVSSNCFYVFLSCALISSNKVSREREKK